MGVELKGARSHGAVDEHRQHGDAALVLESLQPVDHFLDATDRERRNDQLAASRGDRRDDLCQLRTTIVCFVNAIAVGGLDQQHVRLGHRSRIGEHRTAVSSEIAAEKDRLPPERHARVRRTQEMPGVDELHLEARHDGHGAVVTDWLELRQRTLRIRHGVERKRRVVL